MNREELKLRKHVWLLILSVTAFFTISLLAAYAFSHGSESIQEPQPLQIFLDSDLTQPYEGYASWGQLDVGPNNLTIYLKNNTPDSLEKLSLVPGALPVGYSISWDCENLMLAPYDTKKATVTFTLPSYEEQSYGWVWWSFQIHYYRKAMASQGT